MSLTKGPSLCSGSREMESNITNDTFYEVRVVETDQAAVNATVRRLELCTGVISAIFLAVAILVFYIYDQLSNSSLFYKVVTALIVINLILLGLLHIIAPFCLRKMDVYIGSDFIAGPELGDLGSFFMRLVGHRTILSYDNIVGVSLDISKGRITGAAIVGKDHVMILVRRAKEPQAVIRAIREHTGPEVRWHGSPPRFKKLSEDEVDSLINKTEEMNLNEQL
jgi:formate/nitrite transporter FocA (FNT family)